MKKMFVVAALLAVTLVASPAAAKEGFYLGAFIPFNKITGDSPDAFSNTYIDSLDTGAGLGIRAGYGFNRYFAIEGSLFGSSHKSSMGLVDQDFSGATLDAKVNFRLPATVLSLIYCWVSAIMN